MGNLSVDSTLGDLLANPEAEKVLRKHWGAALDNPQLQMAMGMSLKAIQQFAPDRFPDTLLNAMDEDLKKLS